MRTLMLVLLVLTAAAPSTRAGEVRIRAAEFAFEGARGWRVRVTLEHGDSGWEHYADAWRVITAHGAVIGTRTLHHPHVTEQPFTRELSGIVVPAGVTRVMVEAHDTVHGWSARRLEVDLSQAHEGRVRAVD